MDTNLHESTLVCAIIGHLVGDYLLQTDWMALNKKQRSFPCAVHCALWTAAVCAFTGWFGWLIISVLFLTHFLQDRTQVIGWWMRLPWKSQARFAEAPMAPWSLVVVDNVWHIVTLWAVWRFLA